MQALDHQQLYFFNLFLLFAMKVIVPWLILEVFGFGRALSLQNYLATSLHIRMFLNLNTASNPRGRGWGGLMGECV